MQVRALFRGDGRNPRLEPISIAFRSYLAVFPLIPSLFMMGVSRGVEQ